MRLLFCVLLMWLFFIRAGAQLPVDRQANWSDAGNQININLDFPEVDFVQYGGDNLGLSDNASLLQQLIDSYNGTGLRILFQDGTYLFNSGVRLSENCILSGTSSDNTLLFFEMNGLEQHCFVTQGILHSTTTTLSATLNRNDLMFQVQDPSGFDEGDFILLEDDDSDLVFSDWAYGCADQVNVIESIIGDQITLRYPARRDFRSERQANIRLMRPKSHVGIESLKIDRSDATEFHYSHIAFTYAYNCWVSCVQSYNANFAHVELNHSSNVEVRDSYFQDGLDYGSGGKAYGVSIQYGSGQNLVYNNIFKHLRHSMLVQLGANGNVVAYNYSREPFWTDVFLPANSAGDIVCHGNYPYANLFEGNIVQHIVIDDSHGINGPHNTFFRNRAELYGLFMNFLPPSNNQNFVGNEITNPNFPFGNYSLSGGGHFQYGNNKLGNIIPSGTTNLTMNSLYLSSPLEGYTSWPPIGLPNNLNQNSIKAKDRYFNGVKTPCDDLVSSITDVQSANEMTIYPTLVKDHFFIKGYMPTAHDLILILDNSGKVLQIEHGANKIMLGSDFSKGQYFVVLRRRDHADSVIRLIKY